MTYFYIRKFMTWLFGKILKQQCSGKRKVGFAAEYCQKRIGHTDMCINFEGKEF